MNENNHAEKQRQTLNNEKQRRRSIRSYIIRQKPPTNRQRRAMSEYASKYLLSLPIETSHVDAAIASAEKPLSTQHFSKDQPTILEIGFGMGRSLAAEACDHPQFNYLGIEVHPPGVANLIAGAGDAQCRNIKVIMQDVKEALSWAVKSNSLQKIQIFFPDPWPKKKHHKRRLLQKDFINTLLDKLQTHGLLHIATDHQGYAEHITEILQTENKLVLLQNKIIPNHLSEKMKELLAMSFNREQTKYEQRGLALGHQIYDFIAYKKEEKNDTENNKDVKQRK